MKAIHLIATLTISVSLVSCGKNSTDLKPIPPEPSTPPVEQKISINISTDIATKATETAFEVGDNVGIYVVNVPSDLVSNGNHVDNMCFNFNGSSWTPDNSIYWADQTTKADFYAYYPYTASISDISAHSFNAQTDQSTENGYKISEFLLGETKNVAPTSESVRITTKHCMSKLVVILKPGTGWKEGDLDRAEVVLCGLKTSCNINFASGTVNAIGKESEIKPFKVSNGKFKAMVVPQNISETDLVKIKLDSNEYKLNTSINLIANKQHSCTIIVNRTSEGVNVGIGAWETDETDYGGTVD